MRLHPVKDGVMPFDPADRKPVTVRDRYGQPLSDVHDGNGFCIGTRSNMIATDGQPVITSSGAGGQASASCPNIIRTDEGDYVDMSDTISTQDGSVYGRVVRTTQHGDDPLPVSRVKLASRSALDDEAVRSAVKRMGHKGPVSSGMRKAILDMIALEVAHAAGTDNR